MAVGELSPPQTAPVEHEPAPPARRTAGPIRKVLDAIASLRLTVGLFAASIVLIFLGTLAQVDHDVWHVVNHTYFRVWLAEVEFQALARLYDMMFKPSQPTLVSGYFFFPGGKIIGVLMVLNLLAAHSVRFTSRARGAKRGWGLLAVGAGLAATFAVIISGMDNAIESQLSPEFCTQLWHGLRLSVWLTGLAGLYGLMASYGRIRVAEWFIFSLAVLSVLCAGVFLFVDSDFTLDPAGLRILWQLIKGGLAAGVLLAGCVLLFGKRAGVVLLHGGVGLLMFGEAITNPVANEASMIIPEGQSKNYTYNMRKTELAVVDQSGADADRVTVIPSHLLKQALESGEPIQPESLPFDVKVVQYFQNASLTLANQETANPATRGEGLQTVAVEQTKSAGTGDKMGTDLPSAYVELLDNATQQSLGVWLVSTVGDEWATVQSWYHGAPMLRAQYDGLNNQGFKHDGKPYRIDLRFQREYRDWSLTLNDFQHDVYIGTGTAKNFASQVTLTDPSKGIDRSFEIKMNNPLRYAGATFYQQNFDHVTEQATVLQVVKSRSWMIPYVSCVIVGAGMVFHFGVTLLRFMQRRMKAAPSKSPGAALNWRTPEVYAPIAVAVFFAVFVASRARPPADKPDSMPIHRFGSLALVDGGRVKPYDTYARTVLQSLTEKREIDQSKLPEKHRPACAKDLDKVPAIKWMMDTIAGVKGAGDYRMFRITDLDLLAALKLRPRPGMKGLSFRYSYNEIAEQEQEFGKQLNLARNTPEEQRTPFQVHVLDLNRQVLTQQFMVQAFASPAISTNPETIQQELQLVFAQLGQLRDIGVPLAAPPEQVGQKWQMLQEAELNALFSRAKGEAVNPATIALSQALRGYHEEDADVVAEALDELEQQLARHEGQLKAASNAEAVAGMAGAEMLSLAKVSFERFFSAFAPFYLASVLYLIAFLLLALSWLVEPKVLGRCATAVVIVALLVHVFALAGRVYISGRPPVTNLYSSAVFIGAGAVLLGLILEAVYRIGIGTLVGSVVGFLTLVVAYHLSWDNDTFTVMQAVLDTQFWLATHVVCITLGYSTTFLAGFLGIVYLIGHLMTGALTGEQPKQVIRMLYGTLCFAILFSFIGTVLGGLWGDDSWGRFWGWDPKENGALIIVLWNALILHARWGAMVTHRGLAALAIAGNIVTCWSWFGVNELGVGLHAYGGLSDGMSFELTALHWVLWSHLLLIFLTVAWPEPDVSSSVTRDRVAMSLT